MPLPKVPQRYQLDEKIAGNPHYVHIENEFVPWTPLKRPVRESRVALVSMGGIYLPFQEPFVDTDHWGDHSFRELPSSVRTGDYRIAHKQYDHRWVLEDVNCLLPLEVFAQLETEGVIGTLAPIAYSFSGSIPSPLELVVDTAPEVGRRMRERGVDIAILAAT